MHKNDLHVYKTSHGRADVFFHTTLAQFNEQHSINQLLSWHDYQLNHMCTLQSRLKYACKSNNCCAGHVQKMCLSIRRLISLMRNFTSNQNWGCFVRYLRIINTFFFLKNKHPKANCLRNSKMALYSSSRPVGSWVINQNKQHFVLSVTQEPLNLSKMLCVSQTVLMQVVIC